MISEQFGDSWIMCLAISMDSHNCLDIKKLRPQIPLVLIDHWILLMILETSGDIEKLKNRMLLFSF